MFNTLKRALRIVDVLEYMTETEYSLKGENTWIPEDDVCPSCNHNNCFRVKDEGVNEDSFAKCFSENVTWDVVSIVAKLKEISNMDAAKLLAKHYDIPLPSDYSPLQEIMNLAANYYQESISSSGPCAELGGLTPMEYQLQVRKHSPEAVNHFQVGWSDGGLVTYLESVGVSKEMLLESGLVGKGNGDYLPTRVFIYPHMVRGRVSHFTFKDVLKRKEYQLPAKYKLNGHTYYNSDSLSKKGPVAVVEGENDCITLQDYNWTGPILCCNGSISGTQLDWLASNCKDRDLITFFDNDSAGQGYREKVSKLRKNFSSLIQITVSGACKDIDEYLTKGGDLKGLLASATEETPSYESDLEVTSDADGKSPPSPIIIKNGCYHRVVYKDGEESLKQLSNFTMDLLNVYLRDNLREREVTITLQNGRKSPSFLVSSEAKHSLKSFKTLVANAIDGTFYGTEQDYSMVWEKVYSMTTERTVHLIEQVGRIESPKGWLFRDCFISDAGPIYYPDEDGVMWIGGNTVGIRAFSIVAGETRNDTQIGVPSIMSEVSPEDRKKLLRNILHSIADNIGDMGEALTILGYCWATVHSKTLYEYLRFFPHFQYWGIQGRGKTTLIKLMLSLFNMSDPGYTTISSLNSGVAFSRKMAYYTSLPMCIDEIRSDGLTTDWYSSFRSWYDRSPKAIGAKEGNGVRIFPIRSTLIFGGEDLFQDPATRARCLPIRIRKTNRETVNSFKVMEENWMDLHAIGYDWILGYKDIDPKNLISELQSYERFLHSNGVDSRQARNWGAIAIFSSRLNQEFCPDYNYMEYLARVSKVDQESQIEDSTLSQFWGSIEGLQSAGIISADHMKRVDGDLFVWFPEIFRLFERESTFANKNKFSKNAILSAIREEDYYKGEARVHVGVSGAQRRCLKLDLNNCGELVSGIAKFLDS